MPPRKDKQKMQQGKAKRASAPPDEPQLSKRSVTIPIVYQESAFHCGYQCDADKLLDEQVQVLALRQGMISIRQQYNIESVECDWCVSCPRDARARTMTADEFVRMGQSICLSFNPHAEAKGLSAHIQSHDQKTVQLNATITDLHTQLEVTTNERDSLQTQLNSVVNVPAGCPKCVLLEQRVAHLEQENTQLKNHVAEQFSIFHLAYGEDPESLAFDE